MSRNIRVILVILSLVFIIFTCLIIRFYSDVNRVLVKDEPEAPTVSYLGNNYYSYGDNGFYGVKNSSGKVIIEARWKSIDKLGADRFSVSSVESGEKYYGIIDSSENIVVPFIYRNFENYGNEIICGVTDEGRYVVFDYCGNVLISEEWDAVTKNYLHNPLAVSGNYLQLEKGKDFYRIRAEEDGTLKMTDICLNKEVFGDKRVVRIENTASLPGIAETGKLYNELFDRSLEYIEAVFSGDSAKVKSLSWNEEYRDLLLEGLNLRGSTIISADTPAPEIKDGEDGTVEYRCRATVVYVAPDDIRWDGNYTNSDHVMELEILLKKKQNGKLAVSKVYAHKN